MPKDSKRSDGSDSGTGLPLNRRQFVGAVGTSVPLALAGCTSSGDGNGGGGGSGGQGTTQGGSGGSAKSGGTLKWGGAVPVQGLDPHLDSSAASKRVLENIYEELVQLQPDYSLKPHLAKTLEKKENDTLLSMKLREGVKFHDGTEMTSEDVMASYKRVENGDYLATGFFKFVESLNAPDKHTFEVKLKKPFAPFIAKMATAELAIMPKKKAQKKEVGKPVGTGPYQFESREIDTSFTMTKFDDYWDGGGSDGPYIDKIVKSEITDPSVRLQSFQAGEYDFINGVAPKDVQTVKQMNSARFEKQFPKSLVYLGLNCKRKPFDNKHARLALDFALDKKQIAEAALYGTGKPTATPATPGSPWVNPDVKPRPRNKQKAKEHLKKAGMPDGYSATFKIPQSYPTQVQAAKVISDQASDVGINLKIQKITWNSWLSNVYSKRNFQATTSSYLALWYPDVSFYKFLHPEGAFFFTGWTNEKYNKLVEEARHMYDEKKRAEKYHKATEILHRERAGHLFLWWQANLYAGVNAYKGDMGAPDGSTLRFQNNWLDR
ncbi:MULTISPECIES: ABC transporter substrate-binding protein [Halorussus]|uniref:ABC transporter substrate-binding protein n=1 Tax=Halorussus TaxID=1070314 RepID=UPI00209D55D3|nr:ABC transporter substrate-binding protein [Halorussus vallis]USZ77467.1 ABC transporter substrate-binding protein [Halorussus vallis]